MSPDSPLLLITRIRSSRKKPVVLKFVGAGESWFFIRIQGRPELTIQVAQDGPEVFSLTFSQPQ